MKYLKYITKRTVVLHKMLYLRSKSAGGGGWWGHGQETIDAARREGTVEN